MIGVQEYLQSYVDGLQLQGSLLSAVVERAFATVRRHHFIEAFRAVDGDTWCVTPESPDCLAIIYSDRDLVVSADPPSASISSCQPSLLAELLELLEPNGGQQVLQIGTGTGYTAALIAEMLQDPQAVTTVEIRRDVAVRAGQHLNRAGYGGVSVRAGDGFSVVADRGRPGGSYGRILATVGCADLSSCWLDVLGSDGFMLVPLEHAGTHPVVRVWRADGRVRGRVVAWTSMPPGDGELRGTPGRPVERDLAAGDFVVEEETLSDWGPRRDRGFRYYVSLRQQGACPIRLVEGGQHQATGYGYAHGGAWAAVVPGSKVCLGTPEAISRLHALHDEWVALGQPWSADFAMDFVPAGGPETERRRAAWTIRRGQFLQRIWLE